MLFLKAYITVFRFCQSRFCQDAQIVQVCQVSKRLMQQWWLTHVLLKWLKEWLN